MNNSFALWLSDERCPFIGFRIASSSQEAILLVLNYDLPYRMDLEGDKNSVEFVDWLIENRYDLRDIDIRIHVDEMNIMDSIDKWIEKCDNGMLEILEMCKQQFTYTKKSIFSFFALFLTKLFFITMEVVIIIE